MKRILPFVFTAIALSLSVSIKAQSFDEQLQKADIIKSQYGESDDRYLDALSQAIQAASNEQKLEEANKYRLIHSDIVKEKFGENSLEYAEDMWRLGNVSAFKGEQYRFDCYTKAQKILEALDAKDSFIYCNLFYQSFWHYWYEQNWLLASSNMQLFIDNVKPWINREWKGTKLVEEDLANAYFYLGVTYDLYMSNYASALEAYLECMSIVEENQLIQTYPYVLVLCRSIWLCYEMLEDYDSSEKWHLKSLAVAEGIKGNTSDEYIQELSSLRDFYISLEKYDAAEIESQNLLDLIVKRDEIAGVNSIRDSLYIKDYEDLIRLYLNSEKYPEAISYGLNLLDIYKARDEENTISNMLLLDNMIFAYQQIDDYLDAYMLYDQYEVVANHLGLTDSEDYWYYLVSKADALVTLNKIEEHEETSDKLKSLTIALFGENSPQNMLITYEVASQHEELGQIDEAKEGVDMCYRILGTGECSYDDKKDSLLIMSSLHNLEGVIYTSSDTPRAMRAFSAAIEENRIIGHLDCYPLLNLGSLFANQKRDLKQALIYYEQAKDILNKLGDNNSTDYISILYNIGVCYQELGMNSQAISTFDMISQNVLKSFGKQNVLYGRIEQAKSLFYARINDYKKAIYCCEEALNCFKELLGEDNENYAVSLHNLGAMYMYSGDYVTSKEVILKALPILEHLNSSYCIQAYTNLLSIYAHEGIEEEMVIDLANRGELKLKENHWEETDVAASLYSSVGFALLINGKKDCKPYFEHALYLLEKIGEKSSLQYHEGLLYYGLASFLDQSQNEDIIPIIFEAYESQYLNNHAYLNNRERESLIAGPIFSQSLDMMFSSRQEGKQDTLLYNFLLFNKGLLLRTSISYAKAIYNSGNEKLIEQYKELQRLNRYISGERLSEYGHLSLNEAMSQASMQEREITDYLRQNGDYTDSFYITYADIQNSLGEREIAIEFVDYRDLAEGTDCIAALLAGKYWDTPKFIKLCKTDDLEELAAMAPDKLYGDNAASENAYKLIWAPLTPYLMNIKTVYFSPAGCINKLAVEHLYNGEDRFDTMFDVMRLTSTREICRNKPQQKYAKAVLYGGLKYDVDDATMVAESKNVRKTLSVQPDVFRGLESLSVRKGWDYLPGTMDEVNQISSVFSKAKINCDVFSSSNGNEESFKALSGNDIDIIHIATHGFYLTDPQAEQNNFFASNPFAVQDFDSSISPLQRSGLLLSGANKAWQGEAIPEGVEDGILTAAEIASVDLNRCDVAVLSACETGLGEITDEGVWGLQRAFKNAGVNTIIMSLWEVDDKATSMMMQLFYSNLIKGMTKRDAFNDAQNEVKKKYEDPRYWASFIMLD